MISIGKLSQMKLNKIPIFKLDYEEAFIKEFLEESRKIFERGFLSEGPLCRKWEEEFAKFQKVPSALSVTSCTTGLEGILKAIDVRGKRVLVPSNTYFASVTAIECAGGIPELLDADISSFSLCEKDLQDKIDETVGAVVIVHIGGIICTNILKIKSICDSYSVPLVEDAAHAHGSYLDENTIAGNIGIAGSFSFFPTKVMTTGEGGMVTSDKDFLNKVKLIKNFGADPDQEKTCLVEQGSNYRIHEFTALLGILENKRAEKRINRRNVLAKRYIENLKGSKFKPILQKAGRCSFYKIILMTDKIASADKITSYCNSKGVTLTGSVYKTPVHMQPRFIKNHSFNLYPITDMISNYHICPPLYPELTEEEIDYVSQVLIDFANGEK